MLIGLDLIGHVPQRVRDTALAICPSVYRSGPQIISEPVVKEGNRACRRQVAPQYVQYNPLEYCEAL